MILRILLGIAVIVASVNSKVVRVDSDDFIESVDLDEDRTGSDELQGFLPVRDTHLKTETKTKSNEGRHDVLTEAAICAAIFCGAGRTCVVENGQPRCACALHCPLHYHAICGSDGITYGNPCELHRAACMRNVKIHKQSQGPCPEPPTDPRPPEPEEKPLVCYEIERDQLRQLLIDWMKGRVEKDGWFSTGKSYADVLTENFRSCDINGDDELDGTEFVACVEKNDTIVDFVGDRPEQGHMLRGLCVDALILMSDSNEDWVLDLEEFRRCMDPNYAPPRKQCSLENELYEDGAETRVDCNICVCACGNWVCSAVSCDEVDDYSLFEPYDVEQGPLPSREERYRLLRGFIAAEHVNLDRIEEEVTAPPPRSHHVTSAHDVTAAPVSIGRLVDGEPELTATINNGKTDQDNVDENKEISIEQLLEHTDEAISNAEESSESQPPTENPPEPPASLSSSVSPTDKDDEDEAIGPEEVQTPSPEVDHVRTLSGPHLTQQRHKTGVVDTDVQTGRREESAGGARDVLPTAAPPPVARIPIISFNITVSEHHVIVTADEPGSLQAAGNDPNLGQDHLQGQQEEAGETARPGHHNHQGHGQHHHRHHPHHRNHHNSTQALD